MQLDKQKSGQKSRWNSTTGTVLMCFLAVAAFYLATEHTAHLLGTLPYLIFLICPIMHFFMHGKHGGHGGGNQDSDSSRHDQPSSQGKN